MPHPDTAAPKTEQPEVLLPPFSGDETECAMCSNLEAFTVFRPATAHVIEEFNGRLERRGPLPKRLERRCQRCDYQWDEALNPSPGTRPATAHEIGYALTQAGRRWAVDLDPGLVTQMANDLVEMLHVLVRLDHPMWLSRPGRPLLVPPPAPVIPEDSTGLTSGVAIVYHDQMQPPAGRTGFVRAES
ncbi:hypothetical protein ACFTTN_14185 [Streptomyces niveus]|uniref:hypothetical protein n=1 Tax=Streptomyces niveus TaxID=193462 RepID=UPI0036361DEA